MKITLVQDSPVSVDGRKVHYHKRGEVITVPEALGEAMVRDRLAVAGDTKEAKLPKPAIDENAANFDIKPAHQPKQEYAEKGKE
jgi:hypothetical protein